MRHVDWRGALIGVLAIALGLFLFVRSDSRVAVAQDTPLQYNQSIRVVPVSATAEWITAIAAGDTGGGIDNQDASTVTNPTADVGDGVDDYIERLIYRGQQDANVSSWPIKNANEGTILILRLAYDDGLSSITDPVVKVFGRHDADEAWTLLRTKAGALSATLATAATDATDGTLNYTTPHMSSIAWDVQGCQQIIVVVETALAGTGTTSTAHVQAKVL